MSSNTATHLVLGLFVAFTGCSNSTATTDAGPTDTGTVGTDVGTTFTALNGCTTAAMYTDLSAAGATRTINFGVGGGLTYAPACARIAAGQTVTFAGAFTAHPLTPGVPPGGAGSGSPGNPITLTTSGTSTTVTFPAPGFYPYYCGIHFSLGMMGVIQVM